MCSAHCHRVVKLSDTLQQYTASRRAEVVANVHGVRADFLARGRRAALEAPPPPGTAYFVGKLIWQKGFTEMLPLLDAMRKEFGGRLPFGLDVYGDGVDAAAIEAAFAGAALPARFLGRVDHASIDGYRVFINPSVTEVLCTTVAEALAMGRWVVCARHPSNGTRGSREGGGKAATFARARAPSRPPRAPILRRARPARGVLSARLAQRSSPSSPTASSSRTRRSSRATSAARCANRRRRSRASSPTRSRGTPRPSGSRAPSPPTTPAPSAAAASAGRSASRAGSTCASAPGGAATRCGSSAARARASRARPRTCARATATRRPRPRRARRSSTTEPRGRGRGSWVVRVTRRLDGVIRRCGRRARAPTCGA